MYDPALIRALKGRTIIKKVIGQFVQYSKSTRAGRVRAYVGCCPFHPDKSPSFRIYRRLDKTWGYKCMGCGQSGDVFKFLMKKKGILFPEAFRMVNDIMGYPKYRVTDPRQMKIPFP